MLELAQHSTTVKYFIHNKFIFFFKKSFWIYNTIFDKTTQFTAKFELLSSSFSHNQSKHVDDGHEERRREGEDDEERVERYVKQGWERRREREGEREKERERKREREDYA